MDASSDSEFVTALAPGREQATSSSTAFVSALEKQIQRSKSHWSELAQPSDCISMEEEAAIKLENEELFKTLESHRQLGDFFWGLDDFAEFVVGEKFAEGAQAELFHAHVKWWVPKDNERDGEKGIEYVVKVFKKGTLVRHLQLQWPHGLFKSDAEKRELIKIGKPLGCRYHCNVVCATLLEDGRFAFLMIREHEDMRSLIDRKMLETDTGCGPFSKEYAEDFMCDVALGMDWLHTYGIVHRDLKASNVLTYTKDGYSFCCVADYECSIGVVGTGFWRAPEILLACKERNVNQKQELFSRGADAYSYGMTCYEILTGKLPFQDEYVTMDLVIQGQRPEVPEFVDEWTRELLHWCWQPDPAARPSFEEILSFLGANSNSEYVKGEVAERMNLDDEEHIPATEVGALSNRDSFLN